MDFKHLLFETNGRINRRDWWIGQILAIAFALGLSVIFHIKIPAHWNVFEIFSVHNVSVALVFGAVYFWVHVCLNAKRLHDLGKSGWYVTLCYVPVIGFIFSFVVLGCIKGESNVNNEFGDATICR